MWKDLCCQQAGRISWTFCGATRGSAKLLHDIHTASIARMLLMLYSSSAYFLCQRKIVNMFVEDQILFIFIVWFLVLYLVMLWEYCERHLGQVSWDLIWSTNLFLSIPCPFTIICTLQCTIYTVAMPIASCPSHC